MENDKNEDFASENEENLHEEDNESNDDLDSIKAKNADLEEKNRQLFNRAKKAEGFELKDGKWVKPEKKEETIKDTQPSKETPQSTELTDGQIAILRTEGIKSKAEIALAQEYMNTGKKLLDVLENKHFLNDISDMRATAESADAVPKGKNRSGQQGATNVDMAVAKYNETGELPSDFKTRSAVVKALEAQEQGSGMFDGPSVVGPNRQ